MSSIILDAAAARPSAATRSATRPDVSPTRTSRAIWVGRALGAFAVLFLTMDAAMKLFVVQAAVDTTSQLGYPVSTVVPLGVLEVVLLALYLIPRTSLVGAVLWTGYLGGAVATHVRVENPLFSHILFPIYVGAFLWASLCLRDERVARALGSGARA